MKLNAQSSVLAAFIGFVIYRRVRRSIGFQKFSPGRLKFGIGLFTLIGLMLLLQSRGQAAPLLAAGGGAAIGAGLAYYAIRHVTHELRDTVLFVKTHIIIESTVLVLFIGRLAYRILLSVPPDPTAGPATLQRSASDPITVLLLFIVVAYYWGYNGWLLRHAPALAAEGPRSQGG